MIHNAVFLFWPSIPAIINSIENTVFYTTFEFIIKYEIEIFLKKLFQDK